MIIMGLTDKLDPYTKEVFNREHFRKMYLDKLIESKELKPYFFNGQTRKDEKETRELYDELTSIVNRNYDMYGRKSFEEKGFARRFIAKPLRRVGSFLALAAHYYINNFYNAAAYTVAMTPALKMMAAADTIDMLGYLYHNHSGYDFLQVPRIVVEGIAEKGLAMVPTYVTPALEYTLGQTKFDRAVARKILYQSKNEFIKNFGEYKAPAEAGTKVFTFPRKEDEEFRLAA